VRNSRSNFHNKFCIHFISLEIKAKQVIVFLVG
jgi:hypothetical protein